MIQASVFLLDFYKYILDLNHSNFSENKFKMPKPQKSTVIMWRMGERLSS